MPITGEVWEWRRDGAVRFVNSTVNHRLFSLHTGSDLVHALHRHSLGHDHEAKEQAFAEIHGLLGQIRSVDPAAIAAGSHDTQFWPAVFDRWLYSPPTHPLMPKQCIRSAVFPRRGQPAAPDRLGDEPGHAPLRRRMGAETGQCLVRNSMADLCPCGSPVGPSPSGDVTVISVSKRLAVMSRWRLRQPLSERRRRIRPARGLPGWPRQQVDAIAARGQFRDPPVRDRR